MDIGILKTEEKQRYLRQLNLPEIGRHGQEKLKQSEVFIAGLGGLGSVTALYLASAGIGRLRIADCDRVDVSNLNRQILHTTPDVGSLKTESAFGTLFAHNPYCNVNAFTTEIGDANVSDLVGDADIIIDATDNMRTRKALNHASVSKCIPMVYGGIDGWKGMISTFIPGQTRCFECLFGHFREPADDPNAIGPVAALTGAIQSLEAIKWILQMDGLLANHLLIIEADHMTFKSIAIDRDKSCPVCGNLERKPPHERRIPGHHKWVRGNGNARHIH